MNSLSPVDGDGDRLLQLLERYSSKGGVPSLESIDRALRLLRSSNDALGTIQACNNENPFLKGRVSPTDSSKPISFAEVFHRVNLQVSDANVFANQLKPYQRAYGKLVMNVIGNYCTRLHKVLEVGCGGFPLLSVISDQWRIDKTKVVLSDVRAEVVDQLKVQFKDNPVEQIDVTNLSSSQLSASLDLVMMGSVLCTLTIENMTKAFQEAYKCLKPGGVLVHFSPRASFPSSTTHEYTSNDQVVFPQTDEDGNWTGIKVVDKEEVVKKIKKLDPVTDAVIIKPLMAFLELDPLERDGWCHDCVTKKRAYQLVFLSDSLDKLKCSGVKAVTFWDAFNERLCECGKFGGGKTLFQGFWSESFIGERVHKKHHKMVDYQLFKLSKGNYEEYSLGVLSPGNVQEFINCHVFVWQKPV